MILLLTPSASLLHCFTVLKHLLGFLHLCFANKEILFFFQFHEVLIEDDLKLNPKLRSLFKL